MRKVTLAVACSLTGAAPVFAQSSTAPTPPADVPASTPAPPAPTAPPVSPTAPASGQPATLNDNLRPTFVAQTPDDMVATKVIGTSVVSGANDTIGQIADFALTREGGIKAWIIGVGGFLGIGTKYVAVAPSALKLTRVDDKTLRATIDTNKDQLRAAPEYVYLSQKKPD